MTRSDHVLEPLDVRLEATTLADRAYKVIQLAILDESFLPGDHLSVPAISKDLGISRSPVREAILRLEQDGLVRAIPRRGAVVVGATSAELLKLYEVREFLEGLAARLAAESATDEQIAELEKTCEAHRQAVEAGDLQLHMSIDLGFHGQILDATSNHYAVEMYQEIQNQIRLGLTSTAAVPGNMALALEEHQSLFRAIASRDPDRAEQAARAHVRRVCDSVRRLAEQRES